MDNTQNISKENVKNEIEAEAVLYDVLNKVFENLSIQMLQQAARVCKSWQQAANVEISKRTSVDLLVLPLTHGESVDESENDDLLDIFQKWPVATLLKSIPYLGLFFVNEEAHLLGDSCFLYYKNYLYYSGNNIQIGVIGSLAVSMDTTEVKGQVNKVVGFLIPSTPALKVNTYRLEHTDILSHFNSNTLPQLAEQALENLISTEEEHNCFIVLNPITFTESYDNISRLFLSVFLNGLKEKCKPGTYSLWGGEISDMTTDIHGNYRHLQVWSIIIRLTGAAINSWSIVLKLNLSTAEAENKLLDFKKNIKHKRYTYALAIMPSTKRESFQRRISKTEAFRKIFPKVPLLGIYEKKELFQVGVNSVNFDNNSVLQHKRSVAYLIITSE